MKDTWKEQLQRALRKKFGSKKGAAYYTKYKNAFSASYQYDYDITSAVDDISKLEELSAKKPLGIYLSQRKKAKELKDVTEKILSLRLFQLDKSTSLSDILPILENMGLRTLTEHPYRIKTNKNQECSICEFNVSYSKILSNATINKLTPIFQDAFIRVISNECESDGLNALVLSNGLTWREISILRAYMKYLHQTGFRFSQLYIEKTIVNNAAIAENLVEFFKLKYNPKRKSFSKNAIKKLESKIQKSLDAIHSLDEDKIMRRFWQLINATLRTNYFQMLSRDKPKEYLSIKMESKQIPELPLPYPLYEIFVYATRFEAIHLRSAKVARGGIRWSDRREDFRTEILGLMKAQKVKNAVIVPSGAKGGFVLKALQTNADREIIKKEVTHCYKQFIRGLLDLTDNIKNDKIIHPDDVVCYDDYDPYLVVAADKGTATFSDIANSISKEYKFWLGDAFASGGSAGYDHKKIGITARGTWESIRRHFQECDINIDKTDITVVGIGDMSGDVFGNGMLYSKQIKLIAAFDHRHIFLDPNPNPETSYKERLRLFKLPISSWEDYQKKWLSKGGGIFKRSEKSIALSPEIKKCLEIQDNSLTPNELIRAILKAPVDLLFNGGVGTYVKSSTESHADVGDRTNEFCRINGDELKCRVVAEGGNLGFTQLGRVEYALQGGRINTDFIDNSAGVDCSDHEVNIKIILEKEMGKGRLDEKKRNILLANMTDEIADFVLLDNYNQALAMGFSCAHANHYSSLYQEYIRDLEVYADLDRVVEYLPNDKTLLERKAAGKGLTRPEMAVLLAYTKIHIKNELLKSNLPENPYFNEVLEAAFPPMLNRYFGKKLQKHRLRREIIATQLSNQVVNKMGITFIYRLHLETGATVADIIRAYTISAQIFEAHHSEKLIESLNFKIPFSLQYELLHHIRHLLNLSTRWFLHRKSYCKNIAETISHFSAQLKKVDKLVPSLMTGQTRTYLLSLADQFIKSGINKEIARRIASYRALYTTLNVIEASSQEKFDLYKTAHVYFDVGKEFNLVWFRDQIANDSREGHWNALARVTLRDQLDILQKQLTIMIMKNNKKESNITKLIRQWMDSHRATMVRWEEILQILHRNTTIDYTTFFIALRELSSRIHIAAAK
jgi:glutamate dehydrogenase